LWEKLNARSDLEDLGVDVDEGRILKCVLKKSVGREWTGLISFRVRPSGGRLCER
jgi:hypothetical protein